MIMNRLVAVMTFALAALAGAAPGLSQAVQDVVVEDFESGTYERWTVTGSAFGNEPAQGALAGQMPVSGFRGDRFVNTYHDGDRSVGDATSRAFQIERSHIAFLIGGGPHKDQVGVELLLDGKSVRTATGPESEQLEWAVWDVAELRGRSVQLRIFDRAVGGWGHINVDHIIQTDAPPKNFDLDRRLADYRKLPTYLDEPLRPQIHFSPEINWMNDPNGLVYHDGEYHLFYQFNPAGNQWGHMSWGHAVSRDLLHWEHLPLAIPEESGVMAFSGSCVVDRHNSSEFGTADQPPMVAVYTGHGHGKQVQNLAYSNDNGRTWTPYANNPVLDIGQADFRDPKVFWHAPTSRWVMVVSLAVEKVLVFYASDDLKHWQELSRFGPAGTPTKTNWECPDLFELDIENEPGKKLWVLEADMGGGSIAGGSGGEYFVGHFDGARFTPLQDARWVDYGRDFYAPVSWNNVPQADGRRLWIGWFNNWETCLVPTSPWRSCMSIPRSLSLRQISGEDPEAAPIYALLQRPVEELQSLVQRSIKLNTAGASWPPRAVTEAGQLTDRALMLDVTLKPATARSCGLRIRTAAEEFTEVGYDREHSSVYVDRRQSGIVDFHPAFARRHDAPARVIQGEVQLKILYDRSTVEVFINDGEAVISDCIFPKGEQVIIEVFAGDSSAAVEATLHSLKSVWRR